MMDNNPNKLGDNMTALAIFGGTATTDLNQLPTPTSFSKRIERLSMEMGLSHIDACLYWCEENNLEPEDVSHLINASLRDKIRVEAEQRNYIKRSNPLPI